MNDLCYQKAWDHKKHINSGEATGHPRQVGVGPDHREDSYGSEAVDVGPV